jgi:hypothetical protein
MPKIELLQDESGQIFARGPAGDLQPVTAQQAEQIHANPSGLSNMLGAAAEGVGALAAGAGQLLGVPGAKEMRGALVENLAARGMVSPVGSAVGQAAPYVAGAVVGAGAPLWMQATMAAATGAAQDPDDPLTGALIGAGLAAAPGAAMSLIRSPGAAAIVESARGLRNRVPLIRQTPERQVDDLIARDAAAAAGTGGAAGAPGGAGIAAARIEPTAQAPVSTVLGQAAGEVPPAGPAAAAAAPGGQRVFSDFLHPSELKAQGYKLTPNDAKALMSRTDDEVAAAQNLRAIDERNRSNILGAPIDRIRGEQNVALNTWGKRQLGIPGDDVRALTDTRIGEFFKDVNGRFQKAIGQTRTAAPESVSGYRAIVDDVTANASSESQRVVETFANAFKHEIRGGELTAQSMQTLDRHLSNAIKAAQRQGLADKVSDLVTLRSGLMGVVEQSAPAGTARQLRDLRRQYAFGSTLLRPGARDAAGNINVQTVRNAWNLNKAYPKTAVGASDISRMLETVAFLQQRLTPTSGTAERLLQAIRQPAQTVLGAVVPGM